MTRHSPCFVNAAFWHLAAQSKFFGNNGDGAITEWILKPEGQVNITTIVDQLGFAKGKQGLGEPARGQGFPLSASKQIMVVVYVNFGSAIAFGTAPWAIANARL